MSFIQIGSDGGYLPEPVTMESLLIGPGERADILVCFSDIEPGTSVILKNDANTPFPDGYPVDEQTVGQIMQFTVPADAKPPVYPKQLPSTLNKITPLKPDAPTRTLTLVEVMGENGPLEVLLNGQKWSAPITELPRVGSTEDWQIINLTEDTHPIHLHLVQFQVLNRQAFDSDKYMEDWMNINQGMPPFDHTTKVLLVGAYLTGDLMSPPDNEKGWKDTVKSNPGEVTRFRVHFAPQDIPASKVHPGDNFFTFDPTCGPGYVWHCHILDHEDNEMMRPYKVKP